MMPIDMRPIKYLREPNERLIDSILHLVSSTELTFKEFARMAGENPKVLKGILKGLWEPVEPEEYFKRLQEKTAEYQKRIRRAQDAGKNKGFTTY